MELNKQQLRRVRDRHHRRHGIKPAAARVARDARRFLARSFNVREGRAPYHVIRKRFVSGAQLNGTHLCILIVAMTIACIGLDIELRHRHRRSHAHMPPDGFGAWLSLTAIATLDRNASHAHAPNGPFAADGILSCNIDALLQASRPSSTRQRPSLVDNSIAQYLGPRCGTCRRLCRRPRQLARAGAGSTLIAGVAVATALMPPLCAAGYGIAAWDLSLFLSALYEFGINVVFIALGTEAVLPDAAHPP